MKAIRASSEPAKYSRTPNTANRCRAPERRECGGRRAMEGNGENEIIETVEELLDSLTQFIGQRLVGIGLEGNHLQLLFEDCGVVKLALSGSEPVLVEIGGLPEDECRCLKHCIEKHGVGSEELGDCMEDCLQIEEER